MCDWVLLITIIVMYTRVTEYCFWPLPSYTHVLLSTITDPALPSCKHTLLNATTDHCRHVHMLLNTVTDHYRHVHMLLSITTDQYRHVHITTTDHYRRILFFSFFFFFYWIPPGYYWPLPSCTHAFLNTVTDCYRCVLPFTIQASTSGQAASLGPIFIPDGNVTP